MRIIKKILIALSVLLLLIAAVGLIFFSSHIHIEKNIYLKQQPSVVYNYVTNLENWNSWSPWFKLDTTAKYMYEGPHSGVGATLRWESSSKDVDKGSMTITDAKPDSVIRLDLNFMEQGVAKGTYLLKPEGSGTRFTWMFDVEAGVNPLMRIMGGFMEGMVGKDFENGLENLKARLDTVTVVQSN